ncbi:5-hydroxytryptamine receptor 1A-like isoform X1 [Ostrinia nubilalis]|uniref:5-hydroxytryptamine receptor 1A-like n=1 Tax=Ostrinia furnacalis TaxID=93504 RepID=UPI00103AC8DB|nr:5-hydroxytryptamine receptor 1A-like [Ostrinia furnacalis]
MEGNSSSIFKTNVTLDQVMDFFNLTLANVTNESEVSQIHLFDLYEAYKTREKEQLLTYKWVAYILGILIILSNLTVVISSGLILKKGQQPKSTYLLLGNVSLADTIIGISIIFGASVDNSMSSNQLCIFQLGMLVCPAMVSIFSVGLIAIDRYIYILHGLYYQRWFNTTRVRIGIVCIWIIGTILGFMPVTGWVNHEPIDARCSYVAVYPGSLILFNSLLSTIPIIIVTILYSVILLQALKTQNNIKATEKSVKGSLDSTDEPKLRIYRGNTKITNTFKQPTKSNGCRLKRSASFNMNDGHYCLKQPTITRSKSNDDLNISTINTSLPYIERIQTSKTRHESNFSVCTVESSYSYGHSLEDITKTKNGHCFVKSWKRKRKAKEPPNKWRAVSIVMLTTFSFIVTWMPFFIIVSFYVLCEEKLTNPRCLQQRYLLMGPVAALAFTNSVFNPLIYAWWHKGFQRSIKKYFERYCRQYFCKDDFR